jgi:hypothetical protein
MLAQKRAHGLDVGVAPIQRARQLRQVVLALRALLVARRSGRRHCAVARANGQREAITATRNGADRIGTERLAQRGDLHLEVVLLDDQLGPHAVHQLGLRDGAVVVLHERDQGVERARTELQRLVAGEQRARARQEAKAIEVVLGRARRHGVTRPAENSPAPS